MLRVFGQIKFKESKIIQINVNLLHSATFQEDNLNILLALYKSRISAAIRDYLINLGTEWNEKWANKRKWTPVISDQLFTLKVADEFAFYFYFHQQRIIEVASVQSRWHECHNHDISSCITDVVYTQKKKENLLYLFLGRVERAFSTSDVLLNQTLCIQLVERESYLNYGRSFSNGRLKDCHEPMTENSQTNSFHLSGLRLLICILRRSHLR